jgi:hypothetical protein
MARSDSDLKESLRHFNRIRYILLDSGNEPKEIRMHTTRFGSLALLTSSLALTAVSCRGDTGADGPRGDAGAVGAVGVSSLVDVTAEPAGTNCVAGGFRIDAGLDNGDGGETAADGVLGEGEVDATSFICNGIDGADGQDGNDGSGGIDGVATLIAQTQITAEGPCTGDGIRIDSGLDTDRDDTLDGSEIQATEYVCDGSDGTTGTDGLTTLIAQTPITAEGPCTGDGVRIDSGLDTDRDDTLDGTEIQATEYVCDGASGSGSAGMTLVDASGDVFGDVLAATGKSVSIQTSAGYFVELGWDGAPLALAYTVFADTTCSGAPYIYFETEDGLPIHAMAAFWSPPAGAYLVPVESDGDNVVAPTSVGIASFWNAGTCGSYSGTVPAWSSTTNTAADLGLDFTVDLPLSIE